jgi:hypothetical protein
MEYVILMEAVPYIRQLVSGFLLRRPRFMARAIHVEFVVDKVALG